MNKYYQPVREPSILGVSEVSAQKPKSAARTQEEDALSVSRKSSAYKPSLAIKKSYSKAKTLRAPSAQGKKKKEQEVEEMQEKYDQIR